MFVRRGMGFGRGGWGRGMMRGGSMGGLYRQGYDPVCVCPNCGYQMSHEPSIPCTEYMCPECNTQMRGATCYAF